MLTWNTGRLLSTIIAVLAGIAAAVVMTLFVAWAFQDVIYFSLFVGIPAGTVFGLLTSILLARHLKRLPKEPT